MDTESATEDFKASTEGLTCCVREGSADTAACSYASTARSAHNETAQSAPAKESGDDSHSDSGRKTTGDTR